MYVFTRKYVNRKCLLCSTKFVLMKKCYQYIYIYIDRYTEREREREREREKEIEGGERLVVEKFLQVVCDTVEGNSNSVHNIICNNISSTKSDVNICKAKGVDCY